MSTIDTKLTKHMEFFSFVCWTVVGISHTHSHTAHSVIIFLMVPLFSVVRSFLIIRRIKRKSHTRTQTHMMWAAEAPKQPICQQSKWRRGKKTIWRNSLNTHAHTHASTRFISHFFEISSFGNKFREMVGQQYDMTQCDAQCKNGLEFAAKTTTTNTLMSASVVAYI